MIGFFTAPRICLGPGAIEQLSSLGVSRALLVVDPLVAREGWHRRVREELEKEVRAVQEWHKVSHGPTLASLNDGVEQARGFGPDALVAVGGGSTIDTAKGIWLRYARPDLDWRQLSPLTELRLREKARLIAVPTTSGSGSEATWVAQFWDDAGTPVELASREFVPDWALLDPSLPARMPLQLTSETALDALAHAVEALASAWATPISDGLARAAVGDIIRGLPSVLKEPENLELRSLVHSAATMAGLAQSNAQSGLVHSIAHAVAPTLRLPHSLTVAILLPHVLEFNFASAREKYASLAPMVGAAAVQNATDFGAWFRRFAADAGLPPTFAAAGADVEALRARVDSLLPWIRNASGFGATPRIPSLDEVRGLLDQATDFPESRT